MVTGSRRVLRPLLALILVPPVFSMLAPNPIQAGETPSFLLAAAALTERLSPPITWLDDLENRLTTSFTTTYSSYDFSPHATVLAHRIMPDEKFGIVYPGSKNEP